jgi:predicted enzyme related to lactoylglutathione lyase
MPRPVHFEIHASDPERAVTFYATVFDWSFERCGEHPYWVISTGHGLGIDGGMLARQGPEPEDGAPVNAFPATIDVPDIDQSTTTVEQAGGKIVVTKSAVPGVGWLAYCKDTEGNIFGLMQADHTAE